MLLPLHIRLISFSILLFKRLAGLFCLFFILFLTLDALIPLNTSRQYSQIIYAKDRSVLHSFLTDDDKWRMDFKLEEITPELKKAFIAKEDQYFYQHPGINPFAICRAAVNNVWKGKRTSGASTITMQVARLLEPRDRTFSSKIIEMFRAFQLEWHYSKDEILQLYLNLAPYGGNIEGVKAASLLYFGKLPDRLSLSEITALTIIPNRPNSLRPGADNQLLIEERDRWLDYFAASKVFKEDRVNDAKNELLLMERREAPKLAPQFCTRLRALYPNETEIQTDLDLRMQFRGEALIKAEIARMNRLGIHNAAILVVNNQTRQVEAYIASHDFDDIQHHGKIDGIRAVRSPGSTLKPLLYGLAIDQGTLTPKSILMDIPFNQAGYEPENYDGTFRGPVTVEDALANSLNIPAVKVLQSIGEANMITSLGNAHFRTITEKKSQLGLSLALGGCGTTLEELTGLYSAFANGGKFAPIRLKTDSSAQDSANILSPGATWMLSEMLTRLDRPDVPVSFENNPDMPKIAWKTGTSYGRRDAWSIGYNPAYTVGVWVGNFTGEGAANLSGAESATPLMFKVFRTITDANQHDWFARPADLDTRLVCAKSGHLPAENCAQKVLTDVLPDRTLLATCEHLTEVPVSADGKVAFCHSCMPESGYQMEVFDNLSPEVAGWHLMNGSAVTLAPPHNSECERIFAQNGPKIVSPVRGLDYYLDSRDSLRMALTAQVEPGVSHVYWYENDRFLGKTAAGEPFFCDPANGWVRYTCTDEKGRKSTVKVRIHRNEG